MTHGMIGYFKNKPPIGDIKREKEKREKRKNKVRWKTYRKRGHLYPLLIIKDLFEPPQVLLLERHQDHECAGFVMQLRVVRSRLGVEEPHGGLVPHVVLIASHWGIIQPDTGRPATGSISRCLTTAG